MRARSLMSPVLIGLVTVAAIPTAFAQSDVVPADARATRGLEIPAGALVGDADALAIEMNPGLLGLARSSSLVLVGTEWGNRSVRPGRGLGGFASAPLGHLNLGFSLQHLRPTRGDEAYNKAQLALAAGSRALGVGFSWGWFFGPDGTPQDTLRSLSLGAAWAPYRRAGLGLVMHDVNTPSFGSSLTLQRVVEGELALRPLGDDRLEAAGAFRRGLSKKDFGSRGRLAARLLPGLRLFASFEAVPYETAGGTVSDYRGTLGFWLDGEHAGVAAAAMGGSNGGFGPSDDRRTAMGGALMLRFSGDRYPPLGVGKRVVRVRTEVSDDRAFLGLVVSLRRLAAERDVGSVLLVVDNLDVGLGRIEELRDLVAALRGQGKTVVAYLAAAGTAEYYLASACDRIILHRAGAIWLGGLAQSTLFYRDLMDRLGVSLDLVRIADWKGAMEPFVMTEQSDPVKQNRNRMLDDVWNRVRRAMAQGPRASRVGLDEAKLQAAIDKGLLTFAEAKDGGFVDAIKSLDELDDIDGAKVSDVDDAPAHPTAWAPRRVAVILVDGAITGGKSQDTPFESLAGSETIVEALDNARKDGGVRAVVLRVNSPGGSASASDDIARAVKRVVEEGHKPVIVSMGQVAASGGYYIAAPATVIFAEPSTTTGSIGIFTYHLDISTLLERIGVGVETYRRGPHADSFSPYRPWTDEERERAGLAIRSFYDTFLDVVAEGRKAQGLDTKTVNGLGRGQVWTGAEAQQRKLVDRMGGLADAIDEAARRGGVPLGRSGMPPLEVLPAPTPNLLVSLARFAGQDDTTSPADTWRSVVRTWARPLGHLAGLVFATGQTGTLALATTDGITAPPPPR